jgi:hypothetical protein
MTINFINPQNNINNSDDSDINKIMINMINMIAQNIYDIINIINKNQYNLMVKKIFEVVSGYLKFYKFNDIGIIKIVVQILNQFANVVIEFIFELTEFSFIYISSSWNNFIASPFLELGTVYKNLSTAEKFAFSDSIVKCETLLLYKKFNIGALNDATGLILNKNFNKNCSCSCNSIVNTVSVFWLYTLT